MSVCGKMIIANKYQNKKPAYKLETCLLNKSTRLAHPRRPAATMNLDLADKILSYTHFPWALDKAAEYLEEVQVTRTKVLDHCYALQDADPWRHLTRVCANRVIRECAEQARRDATMRIWDIEIERDTIAMWLVELFENLGKDKKIFMSLERVWSNDSPSTRWF